MKTKYLIVLCFLALFSCKEQNNSIKKSWCVSEVHIENEAKYLNGIFDQLILKFDSTGKVTNIRNGKENFGTYEIMNKNYIHMNIDIEYRNTIEIVDVYFYIDFIDSETVLFKLDDKSGKNYIKLIEGENCSEQ